MTSLLAKRLVMLAILLGAILRFGGIRSKSLWEDEIISLAFATGHSFYPWRENLHAVYDAHHYRAFLALEPTYFFQRLATILETETQAPLYFFLLNLWIHLFGTSEVALRSLSVMASLASIPVLYALGRRVASLHAAVYGALIFALAPFQVAFAQYNRPYALLVFFTILSTLAAVRVCQGAAWKWWLTYAISSVLGLYTHYLYLWSLIFHSILVSFVQRGNRRVLLRWGLTHLAILSALLPWAPVFLAQLRWNREAEAMTWFYWFSSTPPLADFIAYAGRDLALLLSVGRIDAICASLGAAQKCPAEALLTAVSYGVPVLLFSFAAWQALAHLRRNSGRPRPGPSGWIVGLLWLFFVFGGPLVLDVVQQSRMITHPRYFITASGAIYLLGAMALAAVARERIRRTLVAALLLFLLIGSGFYLLGFSGTLIYEQGAREVARYLDRNVAPEDLVIVLSPGPEPKDLAYYLHSNPDFGRILIPARWKSAPDIPVQLPRHTEGRRRVWFLDDRGPEERARTAVLAWLRTRYHEPEVRRFKNLDLFFFSSTEGR